MMVQQEKRGRLKGGLRAAANGQMTYLKRAERARHKEIKKIIEKGQN